MSCNLFSSLVRDGLTPNIFRYLNFFSSICSPISCHSLEVSSKDCVKDSRLTLEQLEELPVAFILFFYLLVPPGRLFWLSTFALSSSNLLPLPSLSDGNGCSDALTYRITSTYSNNASCNLVLYISQYHSWSLFSNLYPLYISYLLLRALVYTTSPILIHFAWLYPNGFGETLSSLDWYHRRDSLLERLKVS